jgi:hypothetical protein
MPAKLDALETVYGDGIELKDIQAFYVGEKSLLEVPEYPAIFCLVPTQPISRFTPDVIDSTYNAIIGVLVMEQNTELLRRKLYRYVRAILELLAAGQLNTSLSFVVAQGNMSVNYSPIYSAEEVFMSDAQIQTTCRPRHLETL